MTNAATIYVVKVESHFANAEHTFLGVPTLDEVREAVKEEIGVLQLNPDCVLCDTPIRSMIGLLELLSLKTLLLLPEADNPRCSDVNDTVNVAGTTVGWINIKAVRTRIAENHKS